MYDVSPPSRWHGKAGKRVRENAFISRDTAACICCSKCVQVCEKVQGIGAVDFMNRGANVSVGPPEGMFEVSIDGEIPLTPGKDTPGLPRAERPMWPLCGRFPSICPRRWRKPSRGLPAFPA